MYTIIIHLDAGHDVSKMVVTFRASTLRSAEQAAHKMMAQLGFKSSDYQAHVKV